MLCLFLPDNLQAILCREQQILEAQNIISQRNILPYYPLTTVPASILFATPSVQNGRIVRLCNNTNAGFILGEASPDATQLLTNILTTARPKNSIFGSLNAHRWYTAEVQFYQNPKTTLCQWKIENKKWHKAKV